MRHHGKNGKVMLGTTPTVVGSISHWTLNAATDKSDVTAFGDTNKQYVQGLKDVKGTIAGWYDDVDHSWFDAADGGVPVTLQLIPDSTQATKMWSGLAYVDASVDCPANGPITISGDWVAAGPWTHTTT